MTRHLYDMNYYLTSCEGFDCNVEKLSPRLQSVYNAALPYLKGEILDLGCGRGELSIRAARLNEVKHVHSVDYSPAAIKLYLDNLEKETENIINKISIHCDTIDNFLGYMRERQNCILLSDVVEHITFLEAKDLIKSLSMITNVIIVSTPISQAQPNERHIWLARSESDIRNMAQNFIVANCGYAGSGNDYVFRLTKE